MPCGACPDCWVRPGVACCGPACPRAAARDQPSDHVSGRRAAGVPAVQLSVSGVEAEALDRLRKAGPGGLERLAGSDRALLGEPVVAPPRALLVMRINVLPPV